MEIFNLEDLKTKFDYAKIISEQDKSPLYNRYTLTEEEFYAKDGTKLLTYVARPIGCDKPLPVILRRTPYGLKSLRFFFEMSLYGYICVCQLCRGSFGSEGEFVPGINEKSDTLDTIEFIKAMPDFDGKMAMCGASYLSMEQWQVGDSDIDELKTLYIEFYNPYRYIQLYTKGVFRLEAYAGWTSYNAGVKGNYDLYKKAVLHTPQITMDENVLGTHLDWYRDWVSNPNPEAAIWHEAPWNHLETMPDKLKKPVFMHCGWYDPHLEGMLKAYEHIPEEIRKQSVLFVAPTNHKGTLSSDIDLENAFLHTGRRFVKSKLAWFNHMLKDEPLPNIFEKGMANIYVLGNKKYIKADYKKLSYREKTLFINTESKSLSYDEPKNSAPLSYVFDPKNPVKTAGSDVIMTDYMYNGNDSAHGIRLWDEKRDDVLFFESDVIEKPITIVGASVKLTVSTSAEDTAFTAKLCVIKDGKAYHLREGISTISFDNKSYVPGEKTELEINFYPIAVKFNKGERIALAVSSSSFPAYPPHPNTKTNWSMEENPISAKQTVYGGRLILKEI